MIRKYMLPLLLLAGCGQNPPTEGATLELNLRFEKPTVLAQATISVEDQLKAIVPVKLRIMVCDEVKLSSQVKVHCSIEANDFNYTETVDLEPGGGTAILSDIPPAKNQVIIAHGLDAGGSVTYQGASTQAVIASRGRHSVEIKMGQVKFPELPPPAAPVLTNDPAELNVPYGTNTFTFTGTREKDTVLKVITNTGDFGIGSSPTYRGNSGSSYQETTSGDTITWKLTVALKGRTIDTPITYTPQFSAARIGSDKFGDTLTVVLKACAEKAGGGETCGL